MGGAVKLASVNNVEYSLTVQLNDIFLPAYVVNNSLVIIIVS